MNWGLEAVLLSFALIGYSGCGASLAVARYRTLDEGDTDIGMLGVAGMLVLFAAVCTTVAVGAWGITALGGIVIWAAYIAMAKQIGLFEILLDGAVYSPATEGYKEHSL